MEEKKYYGTITELQEIRKALKYLATSYDNLSQQLANQNAQAIAEQLTLRFEATVESVVKKYATDDNIPKLTSKEELLNELRIYKREYNFARTQEQRDKYRSLINSIMNELNENY